MKKLEDDPQVKGMIGGSKVSLIFLIALAIFGYPIQFSIILALVAGFSYGLLVAWWHGPDEPPAQPLLKNFEQALPHKKGRNNINLARDQRKKQKQDQTDRAKARAERASQRQQPYSNPNDNQDDQGNSSDPDQN